MCGKWRKVNCIRVDLQGQVSLGYYKLSPGCTWMWYEDMNYFWANITRGICAPLTLPPLCVMLYDPRWLHTSYSVVFPRTTTFSIVECEIAEKGMTKKERYKELERLSRNNALSTPWTMDLQVPANLDFQEIASQGLSE